MAKILSDVSWLLEDALKERIAEEAKRDPDRAKNNPTKRYGMPIAVGDEYLIYLQQVIDPHIEKAIAASLDYEDALRGDKAGKKVEKDKAILHANVMFNILKRSHESLFEEVKTGVHLSMHRFLMRTTALPDRGSILEERSMLNPAQQNPLYPLFANAQELRGEKSDLDAEFWRDYSNEEDGKKALKKVVGWIKTKEKFADITPKKDAKKRLSAEEEKRISDEEISTLTEKDRRLVTALTQKANRLLADAKATDWEKDVAEKLWKDINPEGLRDKNRAESALALARLDVMLKHPRLFDTFNQIQRIGALEREIQVQQAMPRLVNANRQASAAFSADTPLSVLRELMKAPSTKKTMDMVKALKEAFPNSIQVLRGVEQWNQQVEFKAKVDLLAQDVLLEKMQAEIEAERLPGVHANADPALAQRTQELNAARTRIKELLEMPAPAESNALREIQTVLDALNSENERIKMVPRTFKYQLPIQFYQKDPPRLMTLFSAKIKAREVSSTYQPGLFAKNIESTEPASLSPNYRSGLDAIALAYAANRYVVPAPDQPFRIPASSEFHLANDDSVLVKYQDPNTRADMILRIPASRVSAGGPEIMQQLRGAARDGEDGQVELSISFAQKGEMQGNLSEADQAAVDEYFHSKGIEQIPVPTPVPNDKDTTIIGFPIRITDRNTVLYYQPDQQPTLCEATFEQLESAHRGNRADIQERIKKEMRVHIHIKAKTGHIDTYHYAEKNLKSYRESPTLGNQVEVSGALSRIDRHIVSHEFGNRKDVRVLQLAPDSPIEFDGVPFHITKRGTVLFRQSPQMIAEGSPEVIEVPIKRLLLLPKPLSPSNILEQIRNRVQSHFEIPALSDVQLAFASRQSAARLAINPATGSAAGLSPRRK